jgi:hypothetical protein
MVWIGSIFIFIHGVVIQKTFIPRNREIGCATGEAFAIMWAMVWPTTVLAYRMFTYKVSGVFTFSTDKTFNRRCNMWYWIASIAEFRTVIGM